MKPRIPSLVLAFAVFLTGGCAGFPLKKLPVVFEDPATRLGIVSAEPTQSEKSGIELLMLAPREGKIRSVEEHTLYARIQDGKGLQMKFMMDREDTYKPGSRDDSYILSSKTILRDQKGSLEEEKEITNRGEIVKFIRGYHDSKIGKFRITSWTSSPVLPAGPVKIGASWTYEESMAVRIDSFWLKEINPTPYTTKATSILTGFALIRGARCAVIKTLAHETKREHFKLLFKQVIFDINSSVEETAYLDYAKGIVLAKVTRIASRTLGINVPLNDTGESQAIFYTLAA